MQPIIRVPPTMQPAIRIPPTMQPVIRVPPTTQPAFRVPPTLRPEFRVPPTESPVIRIPPTQDPAFRIPPTENPAFRIPPTESPVSNAGINSPGLGEIATEGPDFITTGCTEEELQAQNVQGPWPCCIGLTGEECQNYIEGKAPNLDEVVIVNPGDPMTKDLNMNRVRILVDDTGLVPVAPMRG